MTEPVHLVLCADTSSPLIFPDNVELDCAFCGKKLQKRPHAQGTPICYACAAGKMNEGGQWLVTQETVNELKRLGIKLKKTKGRIRKIRPIREAS